MRKIVRKIRLLLVACTIGIPSILLAQSADPNPGGGSEPGDNVCDTCVPFDGGVSLLVAAGLAFGFKKAYNKKKEEKDLQAS